MKMNQGNELLVREILLLCFFVVQISCIYQGCSSNSNCPVNAICGFRNYCVCNNGWIMNCTTPAQGTSGNMAPANITQSYSYFIILPQDLNTFLKFTIKISTNETITQELVVTLWGQTGYLSDLTSSNEIDTINIPINNSDVQSLDTTYYQFGLQPNGESQAIYMGIKLNSTTTTIYPIDLSVTQQGAYAQNTLKVVLTIMLSIVSVACFVLFAFCIYRRRRMGQMRERAQQQKQVKSTQHFDQYMPKVTADRINIPLQCCSVCLNDILFENFVRLTICKHLFHADCIDSWCKKNNSCPICRQELDLQSCKKILGEEFDLSQVVETKRLNDSNSKEVEMMQINPIHKQNQIHNQEEIVQENSIRSPML